MKTVNYLVGTALAWALLYGLPYPWNLRLTTALMAVGAVMFLLWLAGATITDRAIRAAVKAAHLQYRDALAWEDAALKRNNGVASSASDDARQRADQALQQMLDETRKLGQPVASGNWGMWSIILLVICAPMVAFPLENHLEVLLWAVGAWLAIFLLLVLVAMSARRSLKRMEAAERQPMAKPVAPVGPVPARRLQRQPQSR